MSNALSVQTRKALEAAVAAIGGQTREGQIEMAEAVANALSDQHHLMVQAGTGTGKSLAYLVPALVHGRKVLVATATIALQRQLVDRDLPAVVPALEKELGREISYAIYKGVGNYVCLQKMNSEDIDPDTELVMEVSSLEKDAKRLIAWAKTPGVSGDRDDAPEVDRRVWLANSTSGRECVGADNCAWGAQCFAAKAKAKAQEADVVVTNPTHYAVALKYERGKDQAPVILAKGENRFAQRIKALAAEHGVPTVENRPVARFLFAAGEVGKPIPAELYQAVAEILAVVYRTHRYYFHCLKTRRLTAAN